MRQWVIVAIVITLSGFLIDTEARCGEKVKTIPEKNTKQTPAPEGRALSLKVLQKSLKEGPLSKATAEKLSKFAGIKKIVGYVIDNKNHDLILIGQLDANLPPMFLEDFVIALRNAWLKYAELKGNTYYYSNPGCSIDPDPKTLQKLHHVGQSIFSGKSNDEVEKGIKSWRHLCRTPQKVRVLGIPFLSRFGRVMVTADYDMKRLVDGSDSLNIDGLNSLSDLTIQTVKADIVQGRPISIALSSMNRFWFYPGENLYNEDRGIVTIKRCQVTLLTEEEYLVQGGKIAGSGRADPLANEFTKSFTARYDEIAQKRPIYIELENLFRLVALAKIIREKSPHEEAGIDLEFLLNHHPVPQRFVKRQLEGRSHVKSFEHRKDYQGGYQIFKMWLPTCGGVSMDIQISADNFIRDPAANLSEIRSMVLEARPTPEALFWDYPRKKRVEIEIPNSFLETYVYVRTENKDNPSL